MNGKFQALASACRALPKDKGFEFFFTDDTAAFGAGSKIFDLSRAFRQADGKYDYRVFSTKAASAIEAVTGIVNDPLEQGCEPTFFFCVDGTTPLLGEKLVALARTDAAFFIVIGGREQDIPQQLAYNFPVILADIA